MRNYQNTVLFALGFCVLIDAGSSLADDGTLSKNIRIESSKLGYALQYRVYVPAGIKDLSNLPTLYVTDGQSYISSGLMPKVLDRQIAKEKIEPIIVVFVDPRDPDKLRVNRRNRQFFCNADYVDFFRQELVPTISANYPVSGKRKDRVILGLSFGGLNAACFGMLADDVFAGVAMQSPALHPVPEIYAAYEKNPHRDIKIYFSIGTKDDNTAAGRRLRRILKRAKYEMLYKEVPHGHNWQNWRPLLPGVLKYFFKKSD